MGAQGHRALWVRRTPCAACCGKDIMDKPWAGPVPYTCQDLCSCMHAWECRSRGRCALAAGEVGGAAEAKGEQANDLQRAAGEATGREGKQAPDKYQQIGDASGELLH